MKNPIKGRDGFSLVELLFATFLFTIIAGSVFSLLLSSQIRYKNESYLTSAFQQANVAIDQITRDVHSAGYPPKSLLDSSTSANFPDKMALPFAWSPSYPIASCKVDIDCSVPGPYDLILEADLGGVGALSGVQWIRYKLDGTTLLRATAPKQKFHDPVTDTDPLLTPYLENVMNVTNGGIPIFSYTADAGVPPPYLPLDIRTVNICLIVRSAQPDPQTNAFRLVTITGQAMRFNASN
jgi:type II secretory pathway pseudopilin PulG